MNLEDFKREKEIQEGLQEIFSDNTKPEQIDESKKVKISKEGLKEFLKKDEKPVVEEPVEEPVEEHIHEPVPEPEPNPVSDLEDNPEDEVWDEPVEEEVAKTPNMMDRLLEKEEAPEGPQTVQTSMAQYLAYGGGGENNSIVNLGEGTTIYKDKIGPDLRIKTLSATGSASLSEVGDVIVINATDVSGTDSWRGVSADYYTKSETYSQTEVDALISGVSADSDSWPSVSADYYNKTDTDSLLATKADISAVSADADSWPSVSADYYNKTEVDALVSGANVISQTVSYSATSADDVILCSASNVSLLPANEVENRTISVKNRSNTTQCTVDVQGGGTIDKVTSQVILALDNLQVVSDGTEYWII